MFFILTCYLIIQVPDPLESQDPAYWAALGLLNAMDKGKTCMHT